MMAMATYRGERSISEITDKLFTRLTPLQREKAESELLKANPQLRELNTLPNGAILRVPELPELRAKTTRNLENPEDHIVRQITEALDAFNSHLATQVANEKTSIQQQNKLLKSAGFKKGIAHSEGLQTLAKQAETALGTRTKKLLERQKNVETSIKQLVNDMKEGVT